MKTLLDEILSQEIPGNKHHTGGCGCASCAKKANSAFYPNWRERRQQRLGLDDVHAASCGCAKCKSKQQSELEYGDDDFHTFWRRRRQLRHDWPVDVEMEQETVDYTSFNQFYGIEDFSSQATPGRCASARKASSCLGGTRPLTAVNAVVLHQTAGSQNTDPRHYLWVGAHFVILPDGLIIQLYPETRNVYHANSFNSRSVGIEFAGMFANEQGQCWWWPTKQYVNRGYKSRGITCGEPTAEQIEAGRRLLTALTDKIPSIRYVFAHRQASSSRENDPGPTVWLQVGEWAKQNLGLSDGGNYKEGTGKPIPETWKRGTITP